MGLWDKITGQFIDVIEWTDSSNDTMVWRFERQGNEIKYGAQLTVRESQIAVFVNEGQIADVFQPGRTVLETANIPILSTLQAWKHGFNSPFKAEIYFINTRRFTDLKWGTKNPVMLRDKEFGAVRLRAFGTYEMRVKEPVAFLKEIVGTDQHFTTDEVSEQLRNLIVSRFATVLGNSGVPVLDLAANYDQLGGFLTSRIAPEFSNYGIELTRLLVENISLPPEVEAALDKRTSMGVIGDLSRFMHYQAAESMTAAASNPSGTAAAGVGMGMGMAMAQQMGQMLGQSAPGAPPQAGTGAPPPLPGVKSFFIAVNGAQQGPFDLGAMAQRAANGELTRETLVWTQGMADWQPAAKIGELAQIFAAAPPPLPR